MRGASMWRDPGTRLQFDSDSARFAVTLLYLHGMTVGTRIAYLFVRSRTTGCMRILSCDSKPYGHYDRNNRCMRVITMRRFLFLNISALAALAVLAVGCNGGSTDSTTSTTGTTAAGTTAGTSSTTTSSTAARGRPMPTAAGNTASGNTIIIGMVASLNGDQKPWGDDCQKGGQLALEEFKKENPNGIGGKQIDLQDPGRQLQS